MENNIFEKETLKRHDTDRWKGFFFVAALLRLIFCFALASS